MLRIAIVGRPNVGKSALLNRLAGRRVSIVHDQPGITRDRIHVSVEREGKQFELVDTGGIGLFEDEVTPKVIASAVQMQVEIAIESAEVILFVVDGLEGMTPLDQQVASKLRKSGKKLWLIINKIDIDKHEIKSVDFSRMGIDPSFTVSAAHGRGIDDVWSALVKENKSEDAAKPREVFSLEAVKGAPRIALVGRPNVGKSSMINRLLGSERVIVSDIPGTTRDPIELPLEFAGKTYVLVDTAGVRNKSRITTNVEMYSRHGTEKTIQRSDIVLLVLDCAEAATRQDREIAGMIQEYRKPCIVLINKWDLNETIQTKHIEENGALKKIKVKRRTTSRSEYEKEMRYRMPFLDYAPMMFVSALDGYHALTVWKEIEKVTAASKVQFSTGVLNRIFTKAQQKVQPAIKGGKRLKIYYVVQKQDASVPTFVLFVNHPRYLSQDYERYLKNQLREENDLPGCPIVFFTRARVVHEDTRIASRPGVSREDLPE